MDDKCSYFGCNDIGADYLNVRVSCPMSEILNHATDLVYSQDLPWRTPSSFNDRRLLVVQLSHFDCGGTAVSVYISHKIVYAYSISKLLNDWAAITRETDFKPSPQFDANSFFLLMDDPPYAVPDVLRLRDQHQPCVSRMYHFSSSSLGRLNDTVSMNSGVRNPTRFEVATALIHECGRAASKTNNSGTFIPSLSCHLMNLRPPLPLNTTGNGVHFFNTIAVTEDKIQVPHFVAQLCKAKEHLRYQLASRSLKEIILEPAGKNILDMEYDFYLCASLCHLGIYKVDFEWGSPTRVTPPKNPMKNNLTFLDDPSRDGIIALITLTEVDMSVFQSNKEILEFATPLI